MNGTKTNVEPNYDFVNVLNQLHPEGNVKLFLMDGSWDQVIAALKTTKIPHKVLHNQRQVTDVINKCYSEVESAFNEEIKLPTETFLLLDANNFSIEKTDELLQKVSSLSRKGRTVGFHLIISYGVVS